MAIEINKDFTLTVSGNFWELNPHLAIIYPYSELYKNDKTKDKSWSSRLMWVVFFLSEPDKKANPFYNKTKEELIERFIKSEFVSKDDIVDNKLFDECCEAYKLDILTPIARALKAETETMLKRANAIRDFQYDLETEEGRRAAKDVDALRKATEALIKSYEKLQSQYLAEKDVVQSRGGRKLTKTETEDFW